MEHAGTIPAAERGLDGRNGADTLEVWWGKEHGTSNQAGLGFCSGAVLSLEGCLPGLSLGTGYRVVSQRPRKAVLPDSVWGEDPPVVGCMGLPIGREPSLRPGWMKVSGSPGLWNSVEGRGPAATFLGGYGCIWDWRRPVGQV